MRKDYKTFDNTKRILVTGCSGFIGSYLTERLLKAGAEVAGIDNMNDYYDVCLKEERVRKLFCYEKFSFYKGNIADEKFIKEIFEQYEPNIVINLAAQAGVRYSIENPSSYMESNIMGFYQILEACRQTHVRGESPVEHLIFASSSSVYGNQNKVPFSVEDNVDKPISLYAATKKSNELMAYTYSHLYQLPVTGLRFFTVYGPMGRPDMAYFSFSKKIMKNIPIRIFNQGDLYRDFTYIDDIIEGIFRIVNNPPLPNEEGDLYKIYNIGNNKPVKLLYFIEVLENALGKKALREYWPMQPGDVYQTYADISELVEDFDFKPETSIEVGIMNFVDWYIKWCNKQNGRESLRN